MDGGLTAPLKALLLKCHRDTTAISFPFNESSYILCPLRNLGAWRLTLITMTSFEASEPTLIARFQQLKHRLRDRTARCTCQSENGLTT